MINSTVTPEMTTMAFAEMTETFLANQVSRWCSACVSQYLESRVSRIIWAYLLPTIVLVGTVGNLLTLAVLNSKHIKPSAINVALAFLAVSDLAVLLIAAMHQWIRTVWEFDIRNLTNTGCKLHLTLSLFVMGLSPNILALTTLERVLSVLWPFHINSWVTKKRMKCACVMMTSFVFACHVPLFVAVYLNPEVPSYRMCQWHDPTFTKVWYWASFVLHFLFPFTVIFIGNTLIIARLSIAAARRSHATQSKVKRTSSTTVMLILVGVAFVITMTPHFIYRLGQAHGLWPNRPESAYARLQLIIAVGYQLIYANSAINFLLYCLAGSRFRLSLRMMVCGMVKPEGGAPIENRDEGQVGTGNVKTVSDSSTNSAL